MAGALPYLVPSPSPPSPGTVRGGSRACLPPACPPPPPHSALLQVGASVTNLACPAPSPAPRLPQAALPASMRVHNVEQTEALKRKMLLDMGVRHVVEEEEAERAAREAGRIRRGQFVPIFGK